MNAVVVVSTHNRRDLTGLTLDSVRRWCSGVADIVVLDDASTDYDTAWLAAFGAEVYRYPTRQGVGRMARHRYEVGLRYCQQRGRSCMILLDNDALLVRPRPVEAAVGWLQEYYNQASDARRFAILSLYRSTVHPVMCPSGLFGLDRMATIGGINHCCGVETAERILQIPKERWDKEWDWMFGHDTTGRRPKEISALTTPITLLAPIRSGIEHTGRFGGGVNGESTDCGLNVWGDETTTRV